MATPIRICSCCKGQSQADPEDAGVPAGAEQQKDLVQLLLIRQFCQKNGRELQRGLVVKPLKDLQKKLLLICEMGV